MPGGATHPVGRAGVQDSLPLGFGHGGDQQVRQGQSPVETGVEGGALPVGR